MNNKVSLKLYSEFDNFFDIQDSILSGLCYGYEEAFLRFFSRSDKYEIRYYIREGRIEIEYSIMGVLDYYGEEYWSEERIEELETKIKLAYINEYGGDLYYLISYFDDEDDKEDYEINDNGFTHSGIATELNLVINIIFDYMDECCKYYSQQRISKYDELIKEQELNKNE